MNVINICVSFRTGNIYKRGVDLVTNDYNSTKIQFNFDIEDGMKIFELRNSTGETIFVDEIVNNEIILARFDENNNAYPIFTEKGRYTFEISLYRDNSKLTSASESFKVEPEQVIIDGEIVETYTPVFDNLLSSLSNAIDEASNLDIEAQQNNEGISVTITDRLGDKTKVDVFNGEKGDSGIVVFHINNNGHLIGTSEGAENLTHYILENGHLYLEIV